MTKLVAIPSTYTAEQKNPYIRTYRIGFLARVCSTFAIDKIAVYYDDDPKFESHALGRFIVKVLKYCNTPPYLKKYLFPKDDDLRYVGVVPPLKTPMHVPHEFNLKYRQGYVLEVKRKVKVDCGLNKPIYVKGKAKKGEIVFVDIENRKIVEKPKDVYAGYEVFYFNRGLKPLLNKLKAEGYYIIGTSKYGKPIREIKLKKKEKIAIIFGSPFRSLLDICNASYFDILINFVPNQSVLTIRTDEALHYVLAILRYLNVI